MHHPDGNSSMVLWLLCSILNSDIHYVNGSGAHKIFWELWILPLARSLMLGLALFVEARHQTRAPQNINWLGTDQKWLPCAVFRIKKQKHIFVSVKLFIPITVVFMRLFWAFRPIWLATSISGCSFWLVDTYFWSYFSWLAKSGCQNLKLAWNTFSPFPSFWSPGGVLQVGQIVMILVVRYKFGLILWVGRYIRIWAVC